VFICDPSRPEMQADPIPDTKANAIIFGKNRRDICADRD
jgi:hypothetical protein